MSDVIGITMGDPAGVGPEISVRALADMTAEDRARTMIYGNLVTLEAAKAAGARINPPDGELAQAKTVLLAVKPQLWREAAAQVEAIRDRFTRRISELAPDAPGLEDRIFLEAAALATKADVREELDRLTAHVASARQLVASAPAGRKLDFLMQEFMREANTLCSKSATTALTGIGLELKAVIEQLREQVQNVE